jgi:cob(I)alamin adenosyltransferase
MNESYTDATNNELASYIGVLQNEIGAEKNPKKLAMLKQDLEDVKSELAKRKSVNESQEDEYFIHKMKFRAGIIK